MQKRSRILLILALAVVLGGLAWMTLGRHKPEHLYQGKPLGYWLECLFPLHGTSINPPVDVAMRAIDTNAIPTLLRMLGRRSFPLEDSVLFFTVGHPSLNIQYVPSWAQKEQAASAFHALGPRAAVAVPQLITLANRSSDENFRQTIVDIFRDMGPLAKAALPTVIRAAKSTNDNLRASAINALGKIRAEPATVVPVLVNALDDPNREIRNLAVNSLWAFRKEAAPAVPALLELWKKEPSFQLSVTLLSIDPQAAAKAGIK